MYLLPAYYLHQKIPAISSIEKEETMAPLALRKLLSSKISNFTLRINNEAAAQLKRSI